MHRPVTALAALSICLFGGQVTAQTTLYVYDSASGADDGSSWCDAYVFLQDALAAASVYGSTVTEIRVAQGTYTPDRNAATPDGSGDREASFQLLNGVALVGGYAGCGADDPDARDFSVYEAVLSGDLNGDDVSNPCTQIHDCGYGSTRTCLDGFCTIADGSIENSYHVVTGSLTDGSAVLDGFTITAGNADGRLVDRRIGGGMYIGGVENGTPSTPLVANCTFRANFAIGSGGGIECRHNGNPMFVNCTFVRNVASAGGGMSVHSSDPVLHNCTFSTNYGADRGGGIYSFLGSSPTLHNCRFIRNWTIGRGGGMHSSNINGFPTLVNCVFDANRAGQHGGGMANMRGSHATLLNCTFINNEQYREALTWYAGGGMYIESTHPVVTNCIFWGNTDQFGAGEESQIYIEPVRTLDINFSLVQGWTGNLYGQGNTGDDPQFVDADGANNIPGTGDDDLRLLPGSPCIDAGDNSVVTAWADYAGNPRALDDPDTVDTGNGTPPITDMGAYEFVPPDCNDNGILDLDEVLANPTLDDNSNGIPDVCENDCNRNEVRDDRDIADGTSQDCGGNGVPDECDPDDDQDGVINDCDGCPVDSTKTAPGCCGCGFIETDVDGDGYTECPPDADVQPNVPMCPDTCPSLNDADFGPCEADVIPTLSGWGLIITGLLLLVAAKIHFGRQWCSP